MRMKSSNPAVHWVPVQFCGLLKATHFATESSYSFERARDNSPGNILDNSPSQLAKLRFAVPLGHRFDVSSGMQYESARETVVDGVNVPPVYLADFTLTSKHLLRNFDVRLGLRNAFNKNYSDPVALNPLVNTVPEPGRSFFVELIAHRNQPGP